MFSYNSVVILLLLLIAGTFFVNKFPRNLSTMWVEAGVYGFIALGLGLVMITGNIDLSVGFQLGAASVVTIIVLVVISVRKKRENQPPASLGLPYFREER